MKNVAIILAGGSGKRTGLSKPKQFIKIAGKMVIEHTIQAFEQHQNIDEIAVVVSTSCYAEMEDIICRNNWHKVKKILNGGSERFESSLSAIKAYEKEKDINLIFHDAVRPLVSSRVISDVCDALTQYSAVDVVIPAVDTIVNVSSDKDFIKNIPDRAFLYRGQTPQGFYLPTIKSAYDLALKDKNFQTTDDCGVVVKYLPKTKVKLVLGEETNLKLTHLEDIFLLDKLFQLKTNTPEERDLCSLKDQVIVIFGGSSGIGKDIADIAKRYSAKVYVFSRSFGNVDVAKRNDVRDALEKVFLQEGCINFVVNTAAILRKGCLVGTNSQEIKDLIDINYFGAVNVSAEAYKYLAMSQGQLLHFTSSSYTRGRSGYALYSSTKAAVVNLVQALAEEWASKNIRVNCINPQRTNTPMRLANFGIEDPKTLLNSKDVAKASLQTLLCNTTGEVIDVKLPS